MRAPKRRGPPSEPYRRVETGEGRWRGGPGKIGRWLVAVGLLLGLAGASGALGAATQERYESLAQWAGVSITGGVLFGLGAFVLVTVGTERVLGRLDGDSRGRGARRLPRAVIVTPLALGTVAGGVLGLFTSGADMPQSPPWMVGGAFAGLGLAAIAVGLVWLLRGTEEHEDHLLNPKERRDAL